MLSEVSLFDFEKRKFVKKQIFEMENLYALARSKTVGDMAEKLGALRKSNV